MVVVDFPPISAMAMAMAMQLNERQKEFARLYVETGNATQSYMAAYGCSKKVAEGNAWRLLQHDGVKEVVDELRGEVREMLKISRAELLDFLVEGIVTPVGEIDENHRLCQSVKSTDEGVVEVKMPNKIDLVREVNRMCGFYE